MFSHMMVGANDVQESRIFYDAVLGAMGYEPGVIDEKGRCFYLTPSGIFVIGEPINGEPASHGNGCTLGFTAENSAMAESWYAAGLANGGTSCEEPPGVRESSTGKLYLAYLRDPSDNKICALHRMS